MASLGREAEHEVKALLQVNLLQISGRTRTSLLPESPSVFWSTRTAQV